ncbi:MAG: bifunctional (p)ppGpp synthetase/guanosine-3',5'-bis(diphosphate) 3'-pyrophosphohydrolase [Myxococcaceae bacterium]|jgi:(p)ppGpp synthase/HD superfamily hydrolase|nr:bifunctional (p)ppGpp synthetase/guanosine-3',5'-bis(diphosphate) 3'-pyrophosphohydrolase [Myxococcaceae bacterium]MCA3013311.1 bifunctional (p)ppGpp synthetase/guanosine-3',5'-bis(diphosphate) 3'-pyrophosphohydrolase [Myxococcaceae bacterium]
MWNPDAFARTLDFVTTAHGAQQVPGSAFPYVTHLVKVAAEVQRAWVETRDFDAELSVTCALLHDSMEDAGVTREALAARFGRRVADGVEALTKDARLDKAHRMADSLRRLRAQPVEVQLVKLADRVTNLEAPPAAWSREKRLAYRDEARHIGEVLGAANAWLARRLEARREAYLAYCA